MPTLFSQYSCQEVINKATDKTYCLSFQTFNAKLITVQIWSILGSSINIIITTICSNIQLFMSLLPSHVFCKSASSITCLRCSSIFSFLSCFHKIYPLCCPTNKMFDTSSLKIQRKNIIRWQIRCLNQNQSETVCNVDAKMTSWLPIYRLNTWTQL